MGSLGIWEKLSRKQGCTTCRALPQQYRSTGLLYTTAASSESLNQPDPRSAAFRGEMGSKKEMDLFRSQEMQLMQVQDQQSCLLSSVPTHLCCG